MSDIRLTNYPDTVDNIENMREPTEEELALIQTGNYDSLTDDAKKNVFVTAEKINTIIDGLRGWQQFTKQWVEDGYVHQGTYDSTKYYYPRDVVSIGGVDYLCIGFKVRGVYPSTDTSKKWIRLTGATGQQGATGVGQKGEAGETIYIDTSGVDYIAKDANGNLSTTTITITPYIKKGSNSPTLLSSYYYIYTKTSANGSYSEVKTGFCGSGLSLITYSIPNNITGIKIIIKNTSGTQLAVKEIPVIQINNSVVNTYTIEDKNGAIVGNIIEKYASGYKNREYIIKIKTSSMMKRINLEEHIFAFSDIETSCSSWDLSKTTIFATINTSEDFGGYEYSLPLIGTTINSNKNNIYISYNLRCGFDLQEDNKFPELVETDITSDNLNDYYIILNINTVLK